MNNILIVDDEPDILELFATEFEEAGYETHVANNVAVARSVLTNTPIDVILSDIRMPGETGLDLLVWTRQHCSLDIVFVVVTGYSDISLQTAFRSGAHGLFHKPVDFSRLVDFTRRCIDLKENTGSSRRRSLRIKASRPVQFAAAKNTIAEAMLEDLGRWGFRFSFEGDPVAPGTELHFRFRGLEPEGAIVSGTCIIRWILPTAAGSSAQGAKRICAGAEFLNVDAHSIDPLLDMVTHADLTSPIEGPVRGSVTKKTPA